METAEQIPVPKSKIEIIIAKLADECLYDYEFVAGTDKESDVYRVQFTIPFSTPTVENNAVALSAQQNHACAKTIREDLHLYSDDDWLVTSQTSPYVHIYIEKVQPVEDVTE